VLCAKDDGRPRTQDGPGTKKTKPQDDSGPAEFTDTKNALDAAAYAWRDDDEVGEEGLSTRDALTLIERATLKLVGILAGRVLVPFPTLR